MAGRLEALHRVFTFARWLVGVFGPVVQVAALAVFHTGQYLPLGSAVTGELVGDEHAWDIRAALEQLAEELLGGTLVPAVLDQDVEDMAILVDGAPEVMALPIDLEENLVEMPLISWSSTTAAELIRVRLAEFATPLPHRFVGHDDPTGEEELFDLSETEREAMVEPYRMCDDLGGKAKTFVRRCSSVCCHAASIARLDLSAVTQP